MLSKACAGLAADAYILAACGAASHDIYAVLLASVALLLRRCRHGLLGLALFASALAGAARGPCRGLGALLVVCLLLCLGLGLSEACVQDNSNRQQF